MKLEIGKSYKIISLCGVALEHMDCVGDVIKCTDADEYAAWFDGLRWNHPDDTGEFVLAMSEKGSKIFGNAYYDFLSNVLEEVA